MKPKTSHFILATLLGITLASQAATVSINSFDAQHTSTSGFSINHAHAVDGTVTYSFSITGNLDGGTVNDTMSFDLVYKLYTGSTISGSDVTLGTQVAHAQDPITNSHFMNAYVGDTNTNTLTTGDSMTMEITNISYTSAIM